MTAYLLDTNVLLRLAHPSAQGHDAAGRAVSQLLARNEPCFLTPQVLIEFWAVATRPAMANGLGWDAARTRLEIDRLLDQFPLLEDIPAVFYHWLALVTSHNLSGKRVHDARLIAVMEAHEVTHLLTFNAADFPSATGISIVHPRAVTIAK